MTTLPLDPSINRCLARGETEREWCDRADQCARHVSIRHDTTAVPAYLRACASDHVQGFIAIEVAE